MPRKHTKAQTFWRIRTRNIKKLTQYMTLDGAKSSSHSEYQLAILVRVFRSSPIVQVGKVVEKIEKVTEKMGFQRV